MTTFDVVLVPFPFTDLTAIKKRPCLILDVVNPPKLPKLYTLAMMTSNVQGIRFPHDVDVDHWRLAGLPKPTLIRLSKLVTLEHGLLGKKIGTLSKKDKAAASSEFREQFQQLLSTR